MTCVMTQIVIKLHLLDISGFAYKVFNSLLVMIIFFGLDLLSSKDSSKYNTALKTVTSLIQARPPDLLEVCTELAKVLLHLEDKTSMEDFIQLRLEALIELSYHCPSQVSKFIMCFSVCIVT